MKSKLYKIILLFVILSPLISADVAYGVVVDRILATVGDEVITSADYQQFMKRIGDSGNKDVVDENLLKRFIEERIILQEGKKKGVEVTDGEINRAIEEFRTQNDLSKEDFEKFLNEEHMNVNTYKKILRDRILVSKMISSDVDSKVIVKDNEIEGYYNEHKMEFISSPEKAEIHAIFLRLKEGASLTEITDMKRKTLKISALLKDGYNFEGLVDEYSDEPLKSQGGFLGKFIKGTLIPPLDNKAFSLKEGEITDPVWVSEGVYILKLVKKTGDSFKLLEEAKAGIRNYLYQQKREKIYNEWIKSLWEKSSVKIHQS